MKSLNQYLTERLNIKKTGYNYFPETKEELKDIIKQRIKQEGNEVDLNDIDVSKVTDMSKLFEYIDFNGDISKWNVSNVTDMSYMFEDSNFNRDISNWNVSNVKDMSYMFEGSNFNRDISNWNVRNVTNMLCMFNNS